MFKIFCFSQIDLGCLYVFVKLLCIYLPCSGWPYLLFYFAGTVFLCFLFIAAHLALVGLTHLQLVSNYFALYKYLVSFARCKILIIAPNISEPCVST